MAKAFFRAVIEYARSFNDTQQTKVVCRLTHADLTGELDPSSNLRKCQLRHGPLVSFRLRGLNALEQYAGYYTQLPAWQTTETGAGGVIFFMADAVIEGRGATYNGEPVRLLEGFVPESLSLKPVAKRVVLEFDYTEDRVIPEMSEATDLAIQLDELELAGMV